MNPSFQRTISVLWRKYCSFYAMLRYEGSNQRWVTPLTGDACLFDNAQCLKTRTDFYSDLTTKGSCRVVIDKERPRIDAITRDVSRDGCNAMYVCMYVCISVILVSSWNSQSNFTHYHGNDRDSIERCQFSSVVDSCVFLVGSAISIVAASPASLATSSRSAVSTRPELVRESLATSSRSAVSTRLELVSESRAIRRTTPARLRTSANN